MLEEERAGRAVDKVSLTASRGQVGVLESQLVSLRRALHIKEEGQALAVERLNQTMKDLEGSQVGTGSREDFYELRDG